jgi:drug/metabolite transporter (DMT)-like permease
MNPAVLRALAAAALFGAVTPAAKLLVAGSDALVVACLLYLGSGLALGIAHRVASRREAPLRRGDVPWLAGAILSGGVVGPVLLLWGLARMPASGASLLLNFEAIFTALMAAILFREHVGGRTALGVALVAAGGAAMGSALGGAMERLGAAAVLGASLAWALDNNLTREISHADPRAVALWKGLAAGATNGAIAWIAGSTLPPWPQVLAGLAAGALGYGTSLALYVSALRDLGAARTGGLFAAAPFFGAVLGVGLLREPASAGLGLGFLLMAAGIWGIVGSVHSHPHAHGELEHEHRHVHDEHHRHRHEGWEGPEPHSHLHRHEPLAHDHPHAPDLHHRHPHRA